MSHKEGLVRYVLSAKTEYPIHFIILAHLVPSRKAAAWANHVATLARRYCLEQGLPPNSVTVEDVLGAAMQINTMYEETFTPEQIMELRWQNSSDGSAEDEAKPLASATPTSPPKRAAGTGRSASPSQRRRVSRG